MSDLENLQQLLFQFRDERNWQQFHTLKNLIISLNLEAAELLELTQWKTDEELARLRSDEHFRERLGVQQRQKTDARRHHQQQPAYIRVRPLADCRRCKRLRVIRHEPPLC